MRRHTPPLPVTPAPDRPATTDPTGAPRLSDAALLACFRLFTVAAARRRSRLAREQAASDPPAAPEESAEGA